MVVAPLPLALAVTASLSEWQPPPRPLVFGISAANSAFAPMCQRAPGVRRPAAVRRGLGGTTHWLVAVAAGRRDSTASAKGNDSGGVFHEAAPGRPQQARAAFM